MKIIIMIIMIIIIVIIIIMTDFTTLRYYKAKPKHTLSYQPQYLNIQTQTKA